MHPFRPRGVVAALSLLVLAALVASCGAAPTPAANAPATAGPAGSAVTAAGGNSGAQAGDDNSSSPQTLPAAGKGNAGEVNRATFTAVEYSFAGPETIPAGWSELTIDNQGKQPHDMEVFKLAEGKTMDDVKAALQGNIPDWVQAYGGASAGPGAKGSYTVNLPAGNYILLSMYGGGPNDPPDAAKGMLRSLSVTGAPNAGGNPALPKPDASIDLADFAFIVNGDLHAGKQTWLLHNTGKETHEMSLARMKPGKTMDDVRQALQADASGTPMPEEQLPVEMSNGGTVLAPGVSAYLTQDLQPGDYVMLCFLPSAANGGKPHAELGMVRQVTVK